MCFVPRSSSPANEDDEASGSDAIEFCHSRVRSMRSTLAQWEAENRPKLEVFERLVQRIVYEARKCRNPCLLKFDGKTGQSALDDAGG